MNNKHWLYLTIYIETSVSPHVPKERKHRVQTRRTLVHENFLNCHEEVEATDK